MQIICPYCGFEKDTKNNTIPASAKTATCPKCNKKFVFREDAKKDEEKLVDREEDKSLLENNTENTSEEIVETSAEKRPLSETKNLKNEELTHEELVEKAHSAYKAQMEFENKEKVQLYVAVPWESPDPSMNIVSKFLQTITRVLFSAGAFFATMNRPFPVGKAILFYVIIGLLEFISRMLFLQSALSMPVDDALISTQLLSAISSPEVIMMGVIIAPPILILRLAFYTLLVSIAVKIIDPEKVDFYLTMRMLAYASAPSILCIIPAVGDIIAFPWFLFNVFMFSRFGLRVSFNNSAGSVVGKIALCLLLFLVFLMFMTSLTTSMLNTLNI